MPEAKQEDPNAQPQPEVTPQPMPVITPTPRKRGRPRKQVLPSPSPLGESWGGNAPEFLSGDAAQSQKRTKRPYRKRKLKEDDNDDCATPKRKYKKKISK